MKTIIKMKMKYNTQTPQELKSIIENTFVDFIKKWGEAIFDNEKILSFEKQHTPNHSCIFNNLDNMGKECLLIATNDKLCLVTFDGTINNAQFYRCEDID